MWLTILSYLMIRTLTQKRTKTTCLWQYPRLALEAAEPTRVQNWIIENELIGRKEGVECKEVCVHMTDRVWKLSSHGKTQGEFDNVLNKMWSLVYIQGWYLRPNESQNLRLKWGKVKQIVCERGLMDVITRQTCGTSPRTGMWGCGDMAERGWRWQIAVH
jgi:hypothetical protein